MTLRILEPGFRSTVQDRGRFAHLRGAIPVAGPADPFAFEAAQRLVGNIKDEAAIEIVGLPFRFALERACLIAATGPDVSVRSRGSIAGWTAVFARAGEEISIEGTARTRFAYLAVAGGIALEPVLGSRSTYLVAAIGPLPRSLAAGDALPLGTARWGPEQAGRSIVPRGDGTGVRAIRGPHAERVRGADAFLRSAPLRVSERSDRMGVRLEGSGLEGAAAEILSIGVAPGAVQVPRGGEPIVLLADAQTTGGYPVVANVIAADIGSVAQALPGEALSFYEVDRRAAVEALREVRRWLDAIA